MKTLFYGMLALDDIELPHHELTGSIGGSASYGSLAASLFSPVMLASVIGNDFPKEFVAILNRKGVDTHATQQSKKPSAVWQARYSEDLSEVKTLYREYNAFEDFNPSLLKGRLSDVSVAFLSKNDPDIQSQIIDLLPKDSFVIVESRVTWISGKRHRLSEVLKKADVYFLDEEEAHLLVGRDTPVPEMIEQVMLMGPKTVVFKRGEHGLIMYGKKGIMIVPPYPLAYAVDPSGAGDVLGGAMAGVLCRLGKTGDKEVKTALLIASIVSSFVVEDYGTEALVNLTLDEVLNRTEVFLRQLPDHHLLVDMLRQ